MELLLVRHGQSTWNAAGRWQGRADPPLTDLGRQQAASAARNIGTVDAIVASPLERATTTARIIADHLGIDEIFSEPDLVERSAGEWQGHTRAEIEEGWPGFLADGRRPEGYELDEPLLARTQGALDRIVTNMTGAEHVLVLTHGGVVYCHEQHHKQPWDRLSNLGGRWMRHDGTDWSLGPRVNLVDTDDAELTTPSIL